MRVLVVTGDDPRSAKTGYSYVTQAIVDLLSVNHRVDLVSVRGDDRQTALAGGRQSKRLGQIGAVLRGLPMMMGNHTRGDLHQALESRLLRLRPDVVILDHFRAGWLSRELEGIVPAVFIAHNCEATVAKYQANAFPWPVSAALALEARRVAAWEGESAAAAAIIMTLTFEDQRRLRVSTPRHVLLPIPLRFDIEAKALGSEVLMLGSFDWALKRRNVRWLIQRVWPLVRERVPNAVLSIVGHAAARAAKPDLERGIRVHSSVDTTRQFIAAARVMVVPEQQPSGIKIKTLEAAAAGRAIVSTPQGVEGTGLKHDRSCIVATTPEAFADGIVRTLQDQNLAAALGAEARRTVQGAFTAERALVALEKALALAYSRRR